MPIPARYPGSCRGCLTPITPGDSVERTRHGWAHTTCLNLALCKENPGAARTSAGYTLECPTCPAQPGDPCLTQSGKKRAIHSARAAAAA